MTDSSSSYSDAVIDWKVQAPALRLVEKALLIMLANPVLSRSFSCPFGLTKKGQLIKNFLYVMEGYWTQDEVVSGVDVLISRGLLEVSDDGRIIPRIVRYPVIEVCLRAEDFYAFVCSQ